MTASPPPIGATPEFTLSRKPPPAGGQPPATASLRLATAERIPRIARLLALVDRFSDTRL